MFTAMNTFSNMNSRTNNKILNLLYTYPTFLINNYECQSIDVSGTTLKNDATGVYDATLVNGASISTITYKTGNASLYLNATLPSYVLLPNFTPTVNGLTFVSWFNISSGGASRLFDFGNGSQNNNILYMPLYGTSISQGVGSTTASPNLATNMNTGVWTHFAWSLTYAPSGAASTWVVYINGVVNGSSTSGLYPLTTVTTTLNYLGKSNWSQDAATTGYIDRFQVYNTILTASQVHNLYISN